MIRGSARTGLTGRGKAEEKIGPEAKTASSIHGTGGAIVNVLLLLIQ